MPRGKYTRPKREVIMVIGPSLAYVQLTRGMFALIDSEDAERVGETNWVAAWTDHGFYAVRTTIDRKRMPLHRFILGDKVDCTVDHKNPHRTLDCRKANLRHATLDQQGMNRRKRGDNKSGHKGVFQVSNGKYQAYISAHGRKRVLGRFVLVEDAAAAYRAAAIELHGEFANFG